MSREPCEPLEVASANGARIVACAHGGHILGWTPAGGEPRLWLSRTAECGPGKAIRGGVPVIWPQFSDRGTGPKHGLARNRAWTVKKAGTNERGRAEVVLTLESNEATRETLQADFQLEIRAVASGPQFDMAFAVENTGSKPLRFTAALHTYLRVSDGGSAVLEGLAGYSAEDNAVHRSRFVVPSEPLSAFTARDWAVREVSGDVVLTDPSLPQLTISASGFGDRVVWNPGPDGAPKDVHPNGAQEFVCVEPASLTPVELAPGGGRWEGTHRLRESVS